MVCTRPSKPRKRSRLSARTKQRKHSLFYRGGAKAAVTVSTNMAGRGTDILLGGNPELMAKEALRKAGKDPDLMIAPPAGKTEWEETLAKFKAQTDKEH